MKETLVARSVLHRMLSVAERNLWYNQLPDPDKIPSSYKKWRTQRPMDLTGPYNAVLEMYDISDQRLQQLLALSDQGAASVNDRVQSDTPGISEIKDMLEMLMDYSPEETTRYFSDIAGIDSPNIRFFDIINPLIIRAGDTLKKELVAWQVESDSPVCSAEKAFRLMIGALPQKLFEFVYRVAILELNIHREEKKLEGDTPEERFHFFLNKLRTRDYFQEFLQEYPCCFRQAGDYLGQWVKNNLIFLKRLQQQYPKVVDLIFDGESPGAVTEIDFAKGDSHNGGQSVATITFENGEKIVYKPKSLQVECRFNDFLLWFNTAQDSIELKQLRIVDCGEYGFMEFLKNKPCNQENSFNTYYSKLGAYICILYALNSYDQHYENIIACGEDPYFIDLETIFSPVLENEVLWKKILGDTVLASSILPRRVFESEEDETGTIVSGMANVKGEQSIMKGAVLKNKNSDELRISHERLKMDGGHNIPVSKLGEASYEDYLEDTKAGFRLAYKTIMEHKELLTQDGGLIDSFAECHVRYLIRNTSDYTKLLKDATHPALLRDEQVRDRHFNLLWNIVEDQPHIAPLIPAEITSLKKNDVPYFYCKAGGTGILSTESAEVPDYFVCSGIEAVKNKILGFSTADMEQQLWMIDVSVIGNNYRKLSPLPRLTTKYDRGHPPATDDGIKAEIHKIARHLKRTATITNNEAYWYNVWLRDNAANIGITMMDFNMGLPGIALFLQHAASFLDTHYQILADQALNSMLKAIEKGSVMERSGLLTGLGGIYYTLGRIHHLNKINDLERYVSILNEKAETVIGQDADHDIIYGNAGLIIGLLTLRSVTGSQELLRLARLAGDTLADNAVEIETGLGWLPKEIDAREPLGGISHGATGIALALYALGKECNDLRYIEMADKAIAYERSLYDESKGNWADLRKGSDHKIYMTAWSHGSTGIGLGRTTMIKSGIDTQKSSEELDLAITDTLKRGFGRNHTMLNGDMAALDLMLRKAETTGQADYADTARRYLTAILESKGEEWRTGNLLALQLPGFMEGLSGIGYQLLRFLYPKRVSSILSMEISD